MAQTESTLESGHARTGVKTHGRRQGMSFTNQIPKGHIVQISLSAGGIPKRAVAEGIVTTSGIVGDSWAHPDIHGGPNQALLLITSEGIDELIAQGFALFYGALGENPTTRGIDRLEMRVGHP